LLGRKATLELRGHRVTGGRLTVLCGELRPDRFGDIRLYMDSRCTVVGGGGVVSAAEAHGVTANEIAISDVTIENSGQEGIHTRKKARVENVTVTGSNGDAWGAGDRARLDRDRQRRKRRLLRAQAPGLRFDDRRERYGPLLHESLGLSTSDR
jgi:hypothetical protein